MIGKSRHIENQCLRSRPTNAQDIIGQGCGVLQHAPPPGTYEHVRYVPPRDLAPWVEHFWIERWCFADSAHQKRELLPHPAVHLVFAPGRSRIYGVQLGRFVRELTGSCCVLGAKFLPGAFYPFFRRPVRSIANGFIAAGEVFPRAAEAEEAVLGANEDRAMVRAASAFLRHNLPAPDGKTSLAWRVVQEIARDPTLTRVGDLARRFDTTERAMQRLFFCYVGASPCWVIKRYRMHEALEHLAERRGVNMSDLAQDLGYFDQAHFTNDFRRLTGRSPGSYARP